MRSLILIFATVGVIAAGFLVYWLNQPAAPAVPVSRSRPVAALPAATRPTTQDSASSTLIGAGEGAWVKQFDQKSGRLLNQFRGAQFDPSGDGAVFVTRPEAEFFLADGQYLRLRGDNGVVVMDLPAASEQEPLRSTSSIGSHPPSRGELQNVTIELFKTIEARRPTLTLELPNAEFDNEMFRISTRAYEQDGKTIAADQVPVKVRGVDYDFDGRGLVIRWNERSQRLELLEIAHGGRLVVKHAEQFGVGAERQAGGWRVAPFANRSSPMFADVSGVAIAEDLADEGDLYRATFVDHVRIKQSGQELASADLLHVSFRLKKTSDQQQQQQEPATLPTTTRPAKRRDAAAKPASRPRGAQANSTEPITIVWTGPLRLTPRDDRPERRVRDGEALVQMVGSSDDAKQSPVRIAQQGQRIECATAFYETIDATFSAEGTGQQPVRMTDAAGAVVETASMSFSAQRGVVTLRGASVAQLPVEGDDGQKQTLVARWTDACRLTLDDARKIRAADLSGNVIVQHPQLDLKSATLELRFDEKSSAKDAEFGQASFEVRRIAAAGQVDCRLRDRATPGAAGAGERMIQCDQLALATDTDRSGRLYPRQIDAAGSVRAADASQKIKAGRLSMSLAPTTQPDRSVELASFSAEQDVQITTANGATAQAEQIIADDRQIKLIGQPARVADPTATLTGPIIQVQSDEQTSSVLGEGSLRLAQRNFTSAKSANTGASPPTTQPIDITWSRSAMLDARRNSIDISGEIAIRTRDAEAGDIAATADRMKLSMIDRPVAEAKSSSEPAEPFSAEGRAVPWNLDFLQNKEISSVQLIDDVELASVLTSSSGGQILRRMTLYAPTVIYAIGTKNLDIPAAGRMLYEDYRPTENNVNGGAEAGGDPSAARGATAFAWSRQMRYDDASRQATMNGDVAIVHQPLSGDQRFRLDAQQVVAELEPPATAEQSAAPTSAPAARASLDVRRLLASGDLLFTAKDMELTADTIEYDPNTHWLVGRGSAQAPAEITQRLNTFSAEELQVNIETGDIRFTGAAGTIR